MSKQLIVAAIPAAALKFYLVDLENSQTEEVVNCFYDRNNVVQCLVHFLNDYKDIEKIRIIGPKNYTKKIKENFVASNYENLPNIELQELSEL